MAQVFCVVLFDDRRFRRLSYSALKFAAFAAYAVLGNVGYLMAIALNATLVPLTILFVLPFAYCGICLLGRLR